MKKRVVVGMSGGVDSSVAALLLKEQGYDVIGMTMQIWNNEDTCKIEKEGGCCGQSAVEDARRVADALDIPYYVCDFRDIFQNKVIDYFVDSYVKGETPNPCIACNRYVKWEALLDKALEIGADYIATGHYARIMTLPNGRRTIRNSVTAKKDQTYALYNLTQEQLAHTLMPVGEFHKDEIRELAAKAGLPIASKPDSQEICFIPDDDYAKFVEKEAPDRIAAPGRFLWKDGTDLGPNKGITHYTIGQRRGLGIAMGKYIYVIKIDPQTGTVVLGDHEDVFSDTLTCKNLNFMSVENLAIGESAALMAKIRYGHAGTPCKITRSAEDCIDVKFETPVRAITPGQAVVFYEDDHIYGGGTINHIE